MLNTLQQMKSIARLMSILSTMDACDGLVEIDPAYYAAKRLEYEAEYRDGVQHLLNSLACEPGFDPMANRDGITNQTIPYHTHFNNHK